MGDKGRKRLLLVEDEVFLCLTEKSQLEKYGYEVLTASSGEKAVEAFSGGPAIDLVLMDINLGSGIDGTEAARQILGCRDLPIVFLSSHTEPEIVEKTEKITSYGYVVKSSSITVLDASIKMAFKLFEANRKAKESESQYHTLVECMPGIVYSFSSTRGGLFYSSSARAILGYSPERLLADPFLWRDSIHADDLPRVMELVANSEIGAPMQVEYRIRDARGEWHWFDDRSFGARGEGSEVLIEGLALDITSLRQAEEAIHARDLRFRKLFANIPDLVFQFTRRPDGSYHVPIASQGIRNIFGCSPEEVLEDFEPIIKVIHPEDAARVIAEIEYSAEQLSYLTCEFRVILPGKGVQWIYSRSSPERLPDGSVTWHGFNANITDRKLAEQRLRQATERLELATRAGRIGIWDWDIPRDALVWDERMLELHGIRRADAPADYQAWLDMTHPDDRGMNDSRFEAARRGQCDYDVKFRITRPDGGLRWLQANAEVIRDAAGQALRMVGVSYDITERVLALEAARKSEGDLVEAQRIAHVGSWQWDLEAERLEGSAEAFRIFDVDRESFDGTPGAILRMIHADDAASFAASLEDMRRGGSPCLEFRVVHRDGSIHHVEARGSMQCGAEGNPLLCTGTVQDITKEKIAEMGLRESEEKYRVLFSNEIYAICIFDLETMAFLDVNAAYERLYGYSRAELVSGMTIHDITAERQASDAATVQAKQNGTIYIPLRHHRKKDGTLFPVEIVGGPYEWRGRKVMFALAHDISDRLEAEEFLRREEQLAKQMLLFTEEMLLSGEAQVSHQKILENLLFLTNAKYGVMTLLEEGTGKFTTVAVAGVKEGVKRLSSMLGFELVGKEWPEYSTANEKLDGQAVAHFSSLGELAGRVLPDFITKPIEKLLDMGEVAVTKIVVNGKTLGDFTLVMPAGKRFESDTLVEIYSRQINIFMTRVRAEAELKTAHDSNLELLRELQHRAKNSFNMISAMVGMVSGDAVSAETKNALDYLGARINSVSELYSLLYSAGSFAELRLDEYCERVARPLIALAANISLETELEGVHVSVKNAAPIGLILTELLTNAVKYAFPGGRRGTVSLRLRKGGGGMAVLEVMDDGVGFPAGFDLSADGGMGLTLVQGLAGQIGGACRIGTGGRGARCSLEFPMEKK